MLASYNEVTPPEGGEGQRPLLTGLLEKGRIGKATPIYLSIYLSSSCGGGAGAACVRDLLTTGAAMELDYLGDMEGDRQDGLGKCASQGPAGESVAPGIGTTRQPLY